MKIPVKLEKQQIFSAALHRISCSCAGALLSDALFGCVFSIVLFLGLFPFTQLFFRPDINKIKSMVKMCGNFFQLFDNRQMLRA